jgi:putative spermidine/putrescine transport system substrate-binding protein
MVSTRAANVSRRKFLAIATSAAASLAVAERLPRIGLERARAADDVWLAPVDMDKAREQAREFYTYGIPDDWANYGEVIGAFGESLGIEIKHIDTDMSSLEEITKFDAEKDNPVAMCADIGLLWGAVAEKRGVVPPYLPPSAERLPEGYKAATGGWIATFAGVPAFVVNLDALQRAELPVPATWDDLLKPEYKGKVGSGGDPRTSGTGQATFLAWTYAHGGDAGNLKPGIEFAKQLIPQFYPADSSLDLLEKGEILLWMRYDFNCVAAVKRLAEKQINAKVVIPGISIYAPSALMVNRYNVEKAEAEKAFMEFVLSDQAQTIFARFGARPIRYVLGDLQLPDEAKANWLPEADYQQVKVVEDFVKIDAERLAQVWDEDVLGN